MTELIVGDELFDTGSPARVLVVGGSAEVSIAQKAVAGLTGLFALDACGTLDEAIAKAREDSYDASILSLSLPDSWPSDTYHRFSEADERSQMLLLVDHPDDATTLRRGKRPAFCMLLRSALDPALVRRLLISACVYKRAVDLSPGAVIPAPETT